MLKLLDWNEEKLAFTLKEDDFLSVKLGKKPNVPPIKYRPLTQEEREQTQKIKRALLKNLPDFGKETISEDFDFIEKLSEEKAIVTSTLKETVLDSSWGIQNISGDETLNELVTDFKMFASEKFSVDLSGEEKYIKIDIQIDESKKTESHKIIIRKDEITLFAVDRQGVFRALQYLKMCAEKCGCLSFDTGEIIRDTRFDIRFIYSYFALFGDPFSDGGISSYPDSLLKKYSEMGINGIWIHSVLYKMCPFPWDESLSDGWQKRLFGLKSICDRAEKYGIKVYLYINEPRAMPKEFFENRPEILGYIDNESGYGTMCTSTKEVLDYLSFGIKTICQSAPNIGGFFTIVASENRTNCYSHQYFGTCPCTRCSKKKPEEVYRDVNKTITDVAKSINENINVICWDWAWDHCENRNTAIELLSKTGARIMSTSEEEVKKNICGFDTSVIDYSISIPGPGEKAKNTLKKCRELGVKTLAKVQFNTSWEGSALPYIPVFDLIREHMEKICKENVDGIMIGWTLGGCPSPNLLAMSKYFFNEENCGDVFEDIFGENASAVKRANAAFSNAFKEYPFELRSLYLGPQQLGPANLFFEKKTNLCATMTCFPYDDTESWRSIFSYNIYENQFKILSEKWKEGLDTFSSEVKVYDEQTEQFFQVAIAGYCIYRSCYLQIKYNRLRDSFNETKNIELIGKITNVLDEELSLTQKMFKVTTCNSEIGYEAANHYFFNKYSLAEKAVNIEYLKEHFNSFLS